jgi:hypothetical protein
MLVRRAPSAGDVMRAVEIRIAIAEDVSGLVAALPGLFAEDPRYQGPVCQPAMAASIRPIERDCLDGGREPPRTGRGGR